MGKIGRNEPCRCGSGKKYKKCCEARDQEIATERGRQHGRANMSAVAETMAKLALEDIEELRELTETVDDLIDAGELDEAEELAREIEAEYPEDPVGAESLGLIYEARGQNRIAAEHYRRAVSAVDALGDGNYCDCCRSRMVKAAARLDPEGPPLELGRDPQ